MYADASDIQTRLRPRLGRDLTADETAAAELLLEAAAAVIDAATEKPDPEPLPAILRFVSIEVVLRTMANPNGLVSEQEGLGAYSYAQRFAAGEGGGLQLTQVETLQVRKAVHGSISGTGRQQSLASDPCFVCGVAPRLCGGVLMCDCEGS